MLGETSQRKVASSSPYSTLRARRNSARSTLHHGPLMLTSFAIAGVVIWAPLGLALGFVRQTVIAVGIGALYALVYGVAEFLWLPLRAPTTRWQVPSSWVMSRIWYRQISVWAFTLGPGLMTVNPYASMWVVVFLLASVANPFVGLLGGAAFGVAHGFFRATGVLVNVSRPMDMLDLMARNLRWRAADGVALSAIGGVLLFQLVHGL